MLSALFPQPDQEAEFEQKDCFASQLESSTLALLHPGLCGLQKYLLLAVPGMRKTRDNTAISPPVSPAL